MLQELIERLNEVAKLIAPDYPNIENSATLEQLYAIEVGYLQLREALHDAIRRPMGVIPASAEKYVTDEELQAAESRRPRQHHRHLLQH